MITLPPPDRLASLVSNVTNTMLGIVFLPDQQQAARPTLVWRTALLPIAGASPITVGLSSDQDSCVALAGAMFSVKAAEVDPSMINDALCELLNMTAGLVKSTLALDQALGLPRIVDETEVHGTAQSVVLRAKSLGLVLWIQEGV
jgi:hypothetical protein